MHFHVRDLSLHAFPSMSHARCMRKRIARYRRQTCIIIASSDMTYLDDRTCATYHGAEKAWRGIVVTRTCRDVDVTIAWHSGLELTRIHARQHWYGQLTALVMCLQS